MKGKKIFKKIVVSVLTLAIMCSNIPVTAGSMPEEEITAVTEEAPEPETSDEMPEAEETTGPEQSGPSAPEGGDVLGDGTDETPSVTETPADTEGKPEEAPGTDAPSDNPPVQDPSAPPAEEPSAPATEDLKEPSAEEPDAPTTEDPAVPPTEAPDAPATGDPAVPPTEAPDTPATGDPAVPPTDEPNAPVTEDPIMPPAEEEPEEEYIEEDDPLDYEDQMPIEDVSRLPDEDGTAATIWAARAPRAMLFALYNLEPEEEDEEKGWTFDAYYVNQSDPYNVTKTNNFDLKYQMEFHASQDLAKGAVLIRIDADLYMDRSGNVVLPTEIAVPEGTLDDPVANRTTPFNYFIDRDEDTGKTWLVFFNYKKIPSGSNAAWQVLYRNQKLMNIVDETPWTLTPQISVDTGAQVPSEETPTPAPAREYSRELFGEGEEAEGTETRTALTGRIDSSVSLTSVVKTAYSEPGRNYTPGLYTRAQVEKYITGNVPTVYLNDERRLDTDHWRFVVWDVKLQGTATQPWQMSIEDIPFLSEDDMEGMQVVGYKDNAKSSTAYSLSVQAPVSSYSDGDLRNVSDLYGGVQYRESWGSRFYVVTAYPAAKVASGTTVQNRLEVTLTPIDQKDDPDVKASTPATWIYADYDWHFEGDKISITKQNGTGSRDDTTKYTGWLDAYRRSSENGKDYGEIPFSTSSVMHGYSDTHRTESGDGYTTGDYIPGTWYTFTTADDFVYLYTEQNTKIQPMTGDDYYFSSVKISQTDYGYDVWEDEILQNKSELGSVAQADLPSGIFDRNGSIASEVRIYAMLAASDGTHVKDAQGWELVHTGYMDAWTGQFGYEFGEDLLAQQPYRVKVEHDSIDFDSRCRIDVNVRLKAVSEDEATAAKQLMAKVLEDRGSTSRKDADKNSSIQMENLSGAMCRAYIKEDGNPVQTAFYGFDQKGIQENYKEPGLAEKTEGLYPDLDKETRLPIRDNAMRTITWLNEVARANKESKSTNDVNNNRVLVDYYLTAYDGYEIYDPSVLDYLKEEDQTLISPGRTHVVFYDLLPYGMQYDASVTPEAGRITNLDKNGYYKNRPNNWNRTQVSVTVDPSRDITPDYRGTGRTMVAFHIAFDGGDATSYTDQKWIEGWGVTFRAYYDWKDINQINDVDINSNLCAFMPDFSEAAEGSNDAHPSLCGLRSEVDYDDGTHGDDDETRGDLEAAYADMVKSYVENGKTIRGNVDGYDPVQEGGKRFDQTYRSVLYAKNSLSDNVATASSSRIETLVHADADRLGAFGPIATVPVSENPTAGSMMNLYTYDNTVTVDTDTTHIVIFNRLENAYIDRGKEDPFHPFDGDKEKWSGTFRGVDTSGLDKQEITGYTVYYSMNKNAEVTTGAEDPYGILNAAHGWYTEAELIQEKGDDWQKDVRAVAVDLGNTVVKANESVSFRIKMEAPLLSSLPGGSSVYTYNNASFYSESTNGSAETKHTVVGNSVRVGLSPMQTLEVIKKTSGAVPTALLDEQFEFHIYESYIYEGEETREGLAYTEYKLFKQNKDGGWDQQTDRPYATDGNGYFYLHADEKAVFEMAGAVGLKVDETENVFWEQKISDHTTKTVDGRRIGAGDGDLRTLTVTNVYRPVLYVQKSLASVPAGTELTEADQTFTFRIRTRGSDGEYHPVANAEYWKVDSVRLDGGIPTRLESGKTLKTDEKGEFTIRRGDIIALFPGVAGTQYELSEVIPSGEDWNWYCENSVLTGKLPSGGDSRTITNYYRWKDLRLKKEITHQTQEDYSQMEANTFTFRLFEVKLDADGRPVTDGDGDPVAAERAPGVLTTSGLEWVLLDAEGNESVLETEKGTLSKDGTFTCALGFRTVVFKRLEAGKLYVLEELSEGIPEEGGRKLYVPNNDTVEVKMPVYSTGKDAAVTNDYQKRPLSVTKTVVGSDGSGDSASADAQVYRFKVTITGPQAGGNPKPVSVKGVQYIVTKQGADPRPGTLDENGEFSLSDGETVTFKDIGMLGDAFVVEELAPDNVNQIYPPKGTNHTGTLAGDGCEVSFVNGAPGSLLISKEYVGLDEKGMQLEEDLRAWCTNGNWTQNWDPNVSFVLKVWVDGRQYEEEIHITQINQLTSEVDDGGYFIRSGDVLIVPPWMTISISVGDGEGSIPANAVYTLEEVEEDRIEPYQIDGWTEGRPCQETHWMQISQTEASKELKTEKSVAERPVAVICNEISTLPTFTGSEIGKYMTPASGEVPEGAKLVWRVEQYDSGRWTPAQGVPYVVFTDYGESVSSKTESTGADGRILLTKPNGGYPIVHFQEDQVYLNLYHAKDIEKLQGEVPAGKRLLRMVEVPEESDSEWGLLAGYTYNPNMPGQGERRKAARAQTENNLMQISYSMDTAPEAANGFMNSNATEALEIEKQMSEASDTRFTMILKQVLSTAKTPVESEADITADRPASGISYTVLKADGSRVSGVTGENGEIGLYAGERAVLHVPEGTMWTVNEQTFSAPNYRLTGLTPDPGDGVRLSKLNSNLMLVHIPVSEQYTLFFDDRGGTGGPGVLTQLKKSGETGPVTFTIPNIVPTREGYRFLYWTDSTSALVIPDESQYKPGDKVELKNGWKSMELFARWEEAVPDAPKRGDLFGILGTGFVKVQCVGQSFDHEVKYYATAGDKSDVTVGEPYADGDSYYCDLRLDGEVYANYYGFEPSFGPGEKHWLITGEDRYKTIKLVWNKQTLKWNAESAIPVTFQVAEKYTVTYTDGVKNTIVFSDQESQDRLFGSQTPDFYEEDGRTETLSDGTVIPKRKGYIFKCWEPALSATVKGDVTYTATWSPKYKLWIELFYSDGEGEAERAQSDEKVIWSPGETVSDKGTMNASWGVYKLHSVQCEYEDETEIKEISVNSDGSFVLPELGSDKTIHVILQYWKKDGTSSTPEQ